MVYKQQLYPKWTAELKEKDRVIHQLHALIKSQEKEKIENLYAPCEKSKMLTNQY